jgi:hypothetical protein
MSHQGTSMHSLFCQDEWALFCRKKVILYPEYLLMRTCTTKYESQISVPTSIHPLVREFSRIE